MRKISNLVAHKLLPFKLLTQTFFLKIMPTSVSQIACYLDQCGWKYEVDADQNSIVTGVKTDNGTKLLIVIHLAENGEFVHFYAPRLLKVKDHVFKGVLFQTLLAMSWEMKMLRFEYDTTDGEIRASIEIPIEDGSLTRTQFERCLIGLVHMVDVKAMPRMKQVLATGEDPGRQTLAQEIVKDLNPEMVSLLEEAIALHKQQNS